MEKKTSDMTAKEFFSGTFNLDFLSDEERETIYQGSELYAKGKLHQASQSLPSGAEEAAGKSAEAVIESILKKYYGTAYSIFEKELKYKLIAAMHEYASQFQNGGGKGGLHWVKVSEKEKPDPYKKYFFQILNRHYQVAETYFGYFKDVVYETVPVLFLTESTPVVESKAVGMEWVKANVRVPESGVKVFWRLYSKRDNTKVIQTGYDDFNRHEDMYLSRIEWLDESQSSTPSTSTPLKVDESPANKHWFDHVVPRKKVLDMLEENMNAGLTDEDAARDQRELLKETYIDMIEIIKAM